jgi:predicted GIY-YIG superfamily endonuclease
VWYVYILRCADGSLYIGETNEIEQRIERHNAGRGSAFTAAKRPVTLVYSESYSIRKVALVRERELKRWSRAKKEALVAGDLDALKTR